ncbi:BQ2448_3257 [Microbotryum intermedium]|uniref:BQ2448_3257 protein n=1 Tax=Microbotryum intermedium TaxID=269621 RepID=A0A238FFU3_9BASI|nr:BQ2448_3257 [Microbotryum intermedium]
MAPRTNRRQQAQNAANPNAAREITGPRSALTSFLREQGITGPGAVPNYSRRSARGAAAAAATTTSTSTPGSASGAATPTSESTSAAALGDDEDEDTSMTTESPIASTSSKMLVASGSGSKRKSNTVSVAALKKKKQEAEKHGDSPFDLAHQPQIVPKKGKYEHRTPGMISICADCGKRFTVTKYTASNPHGSGLLCSPCTSESIEDRAANPLKPVAKKVVKKRQKVVEETQFRPIKTLQQTVIDVIGNHIDDVEALGDIGAKNLDRIAKIVCKNRALTGQNLSLFLEIDHTELSLYDCTKIEDHHLASIATFCPRLERIKLNLCGRLDDSVLDAWAKGFKNLKSLNLYAPYLVTNTKWREYLSTFGTGRGQHQLEGFCIRQSARFDDECIKVLVERNPQLQQLQLSEIGKLNDTSLALLHPLKHLTSLDLSRSGTPQGTTLTDDGVVALLENVGEQLVTLVLDENALLTDRTLLEGIKIHCPNLRVLSLKLLSNIQSKGLEALFLDWVNTGLTHLNLHRVLLLENEAIQAVLDHSGASLKHLDLHSVDEIEDFVLNEVADKAPNLEVLDLSFVRSCDNFVVKKVLDQCRKLENLFVHGCNRVTEDCPSRKGCSIRGLENCIAVEL